MLARQQQRIRPDLRITPDQFALVRTEFFRSESAGFYFGPKGLQSTGNQILVKNGRFLRACPVGGGQP